MCTDRPALGEMLEDLVTLGAIQFRPEPLDAIVEQRLKAIWAARSCPNCGEDTLQAVIEEAADLSQPLGEVWTDGLPAYQGMEHDHRYVVHDDGYVSEGGIHTNQAECLWSLLQPWLAKFRGLSKQGLEHAAQTYGFLRSLNLTRAPVHALIDCVAVNAFR